MGCGTSKAVTVVDQEAPENLKDAPDSTPAPLISEATEELTSIHSNSPDRDSKPVEPSNKSASSPPVIHSNGTDLGLPSPPQSLPEAPAPSQPSVPDKESTKGSPESTLPQSAGGRAVAFEVDSVDQEGPDSLIKRHPPRKFQKLEDQPQSTSLTQEKLEEKQQVAEKRRQEILTQRVQSAKQRSARSAGRMRTRPSENDEVEQLEDGTIESAANIATENEL